MVDINWNESKWRFMLSVCCLWLQRCRFGLSCDETSVLLATYIVLQFWTFVNEDFHRRSAHHLYCLETSFTCWEAADTKWGYRLQAGSCYLFYENKLDAIAWVTCDWFNPRVTKGGGNPPKGFFLTL